MKVSKNQAVWAWCHLAGLASGIDWTAWSSADSGSGQVQGAGAHGLVAGQGLARSFVGAGQPAGLDGAVGGAHARVSSRLQDGDLGMGGAPGSD